MRLAISMRVLANNTYAEKSDTISHDWQRLLEPLGHTLYPVPNNACDLSKWLKTIDVQGIILSGGNSVAHPLANKETVFPERDKTESDLIHYAELHDLPLLAVCRGFQFLNNYYGGTIQPNFCPGPERGQHVASFHDIKLVNPAWSKLIEQDKITVNSYHDDGILLNQLAQTLNLAATSDNGQFVEAAIHLNHRFIGIMWHPEREGHDTKLDSKLLDNLFSYLFNPLFLDGFLP